MCLVYSIFRVALAPTAALTSGSYYGAIQDSATGCESCPIIGNCKCKDPGTPTTNSTTRILFGE
jgi:hypothetical protein